MENLYRIDPKRIIVPEGRIRKEFDESKIRKLADSFKLYGQISPVLCKKEDDNLVLVAGERRLRACVLANMELLYVLADEADPITLREIELEENIQRQNLTWNEEVNAKLELHELKQEQFGSSEMGKAGGHSISDTAKMLGESVGNVAEDLELAVYADHFEEVREAKKKTDAKKVVKRIKAELKREKKLAEAIIAEHNAEGPSAESSDLSEKLVYFDSRVLQGTMEEQLNQFEDGFFNVVIFDPPWQVGLNEVRKKGGGTRDFEDSGDPELKRLEDQLKQISKKMHKDSHLYLFFGIVHYTRIYQLLNDCGFETNGIPIIWYKQGAHVTRNPNLWPGRCYEPIAYARKGSKNLVRLGAPDVIVTPMPTESIKQSHPSAKHPDVMLELLKRSAEPGDHVLDPMCGSGMTGVAAEVLRPTHKLDWWMIEKEESFRDLAVLNVTQGYNEITRFKHDKLPVPDYIIPPLPEDFRELEIGSAQWKQFWEEQPEEQAAMLAWKAQQKGE